VRFLKLHAEVLVHFQRDLLNPLGGLLGDGIADGDAGLGKQLLGGCFRHSLGSDVDELGRAFERLLESSLGLDPLHDACDRKLRLRLITYLPGLYQA
jgi:hypothetical protein